MHGVCVLQALLFGIMVLRYRKPHGNAKKTLLIVGIGGFLMLMIDLFFLGGINYIRFPSSSGSFDIVESYVPVPVEDYFNLPPEAVNAPLPVVEDMLSPEDVPEHDKAEPDAALEVVPSAPSPEHADIDILKWQEYAAAFEPAAGNSKAKVIIIIDDMGLSKARSSAVAALPAPLTLAYLPYAPDVRKQAATARAFGHELMIHTPMEPMSADQDPGPMALMDAMSAEEVDENLKKIFASFDGYIGINNHMGSKLTQNSRIMHQVMQALKEKGLVFIDSKTISSSVAADIAAEEGIYYAQRDVFLDHEETVEFVMGALEKLEAIAHRKGYAIAIGHPKDVTVEALQKWLPTLDEKGLELAPVSVVLSVQSQVAQR